MMRDRRPKGDQRLEHWATVVHRQLPAALSAQNVTHSGQLSQGKRPLPRLVGKGEPIEHGWRWTLDLPGNSQAEDWDANRIVAALNTGRHLAAVGEIHHHREGWAALHVHRREPLTGPQPVPWKPGEQPSCCRPGTVCIGRQRDGKHIHFDIVSDVGALATLLAGRRGSGKSETARLIVSQMVAWGWAPPIVVDLVRHGVDYHAFVPLLDRPIVTTNAEAKDALKFLEADANERAERLRRVGQQKVNSYSRDLPLRPLIWDEVQAINDDRGLKKQLRRWAQQARPMGGAPVLLTQYPTAENVDATLRAQIANVWCGRLRNHVEAGVVFGPLPEGVGPQYLRIGPGGCMADVDGPDLLIGRSWYTPDGWHEQHVGRLLKRRVRV